MTVYRAITGTIDLRTGLHVGTGQDDSATDAVCRRNSQGQWVIPGTSLGGALRSLATRLAPRFFTDRATCLALLPDAQHNASCDCIVCELFGFRFLDDDRTDSSGPTASRIWIYDAVANRQQHTRIRDGVGINRTTGAAERQGASKFDLEIVPAGTRFDFRMELHEDVAVDAEQLLAAVLAEWQAGRCTLGGRSGRGLGGFTLSDVQFVLRDLGRNDSLLAFLESDAPWQIDTAVAETSADSNWICNRITPLRNTVVANEGLPEAVASSFLSVEFALKFDGPLVLNDPATAAVTGYDFAPRIEQFREGSRLVLPGASLRGVLRSQAERIARTIVSQNVAGMTDAAREFLKHCPACDPLQNDNASDPLASCQSLVKEYAKQNPENHGGKANADLGFDPENVPGDRFCPACQLFGSTYYGSRLRVDDSYSNCSTVHAQDFLKIDRFTGGGIDNAKFDAIGAWKPEFTIRIFLENPHAHELAWLTFVFRDLKNGLLRFGFGGAKGFGRAQLEAATFGLAFLDTSDLNLLFDGNDVSQTCGQAQADGMYNVAEYSWDAWRELVTNQDLVAAFRSKFANFKRDPFRLKNKTWEPMKLAADSYFGVSATKDIATLLSDVYPIHVTADASRSGE